MRVPECYCWKWLYDIEMVYSIRLHLAARRLQCMGHVVVGHSTSVIQHRILLRILTHEMSLTHVPVRLQHVKTFMQNAAESLLQNRLEQQRLTKPHWMSELQKSSGVFSNLVEPREQFVQTVVSHFIRSWTWFDNPYPHCTVWIGSWSLTEGKLRQTLLKGS